MNKATLKHRAALTGALAVVGLVGALLLSGFWPGEARDVRAQAGACPGASQGAAAENQQAFVDVGAGNTATYVCVSSSSFAGGISGPITANGPVANGCYFVEGLATSVVAVFRESPAIKQCPDLVRIDVGTGAPPTPTATATTTTTATATATTTQPTGTATVAPKPPPSGTGTRDDEGLGFHVYAAGLAFLGVAALAAGGMYAYSRKQR